MPGLPAIRDSVRDPEVAEGEGFEPPDPQNGSTVFKTVAFVRSATPPCRAPDGVRRRPPSYSTAKPKPSLPFSRQRVPIGEKPSQALAQSMVDGTRGSATIKRQVGKVAHVTTETNREREKGIRRGEVQCCTWGEPDGSR